jgi:ABC-type nitrate/sulfonate/bicarbonate transport system permease component
VVGFANPNVLLVVLSLTLTLLAWGALAAATQPILLPGPMLVAQTALDLVADGAIPQHVAASVARVLAGFLLGSAVGIPVGLAMGQFRPVRWLLEPYVETLRFVSPIALLGIIVVLFGLSEAGKVVLIFHSTVFIVLINTMIGVLRVPVVTMRSALSLGASPPQMFVRVTVPSTMPYIVAGMRIAIGSAFMTVVAAEMIFATSGIGYLITNARVYFRTDEVFVGIFLLGALGLISDGVLRLIAKRFGEKYGVRF